jgi:hypothetical protein
VSEDRVQLVARIREIEHQREALRQASEQTSLESLAARLALRRAQEVSDEAARKALLADSMFHLEHEKLRDAREELAILMLKEDAK